MTIDLPRALEPWRSVLSIFPVEIARSVGDVVARLSVLVGPLERETAAPRGEPDGVAGIGRRGPFERLLATEWALLDEVPDEFMRRAAGGELGFYEIARREPSADRRSIALFDVGIDQLGAPRIVHLAALVLLAQRALDARAHFAWGLLQDPASTLHESVTENAVLGLVRGRIARAASADDMARWAKVLGIADAKPDENRELWIIGGARTPDLAPRLSHARIVVDDSLDPSAPRVLEVAVLTARRPRRAARLEIPAPEIGVRLLRNPFHASTGPRPVVTAGLGPGALPFVFSWNGKKIFTRSKDGGLLTLAIGTDANPRVFSMPKGVELLAVGVVRKKQRTVILVRGERGLEIQGLGRRDRGTVWSALVHPSDMPAIGTDQTAPLYPLFPVDHDESFLFHEEQLSRIHHPHAAPHGITHLVIRALFAVRSRDGAGVVVVSANGNTRVLRCSIGATSAAETESVPALAGQSLLLADAPRIVAGLDFIALEDATGAFSTFDLAVSGPPTMLVPRKGDEVIGVVHRARVPSLVVVAADRTKVERISPSDAEVLVEIAGTIAHAQLSTYGDHLAILNARGTLEIRALGAPGQLVASYELGALS